MAITAAVTEVEETIARISAIKGVEGVVIMTKEGKIGHCKFSFPSGLQWISNLTKSIDRADEFACISNNFKTNIIYFLVRQALSFSRLYRKINRNSTVLSYRPWQKRPPY
jgi:hypothetical protein